MALSVFQGLATEDARAFRAAIIFQTAINRFWVAGDGPGEKERHGEGELFHGALFLF